MEKRGITYSTLFFLQRYFADVIPESSGVYFWVYCPFTGIDPNDPALHLQTLCSEFSNKELRYEEQFEGKYKFSGSIIERGFPQNGYLFGLPEKKAKELALYLEKGSENRQEFIRMLEELCFSRPFYVGKANNLRSRIKQHLSRNGSDILENIDSKKIDYSHVWVGHLPIHDHMTPNINNIIEEIFSRFLKPGLTLKPN